MDQDTAKRHIRAFEFRRLFLEVLGWDRYTVPLRVEVDGRAITLQPLAQKRGVVALLHAAEDTIPPHAVRMKIERQVARSHRQHLLVYSDERKQEQVWQWVRQEPGKPLASRDHRYHVSQPGDALTQKLQGIAFSLEEEESLTHVDVTSRVRASFDVERATKKFYDQFKRERDAFERFLQGVPAGDMARWYVSVMLDRLMFIYFIQRKGFLDDDPNYLRNKLQQSQQQGADRYYCDLLCPLFFEGFARPAAERSPASRTLLGNVPYLNGGIFERHQVEKVHGKDIHLPDAAFRRLFDFFDQYQWYLDDRPLHQDNEINPDVLGYIFEKYINQKEMGAYYTQEDVTGYIGRNTIIPFLLNETRRHCRRAFQGDGSVWRLLREDPDRYIYPALKHGFLAGDGALRPLPPEIAAGIDDVGRRSPWNTPTPEPFALPTEIWRETVARRGHYEEVRNKLAAGEMREVDDLVTYNLDIQQFAQDVVETCEEPDLLRALWKAIQEISVLDPTCGSGAFLFAALNILEPLYEACLARMEAFLAELGPEANPQKYRDLRQVLEQANRHANRRYFVLKSIVVNNLYGVDIMAEAVEIARLRLFLKLVAQVETTAQIEPLPDIDFNIQAGNTLVGFTSREQVQAALRSEQKGGGVSQDRLLFGEDEARLHNIEEQAEAVDRLYHKFRKMQTAHDMSGYSQDFADTKAELRRRLQVMENELHRALAGQYGVDVGQKEAYQRWLDSHQPFHWFVEFYGIMKAGGFSVTIGNPPWVEYSKIRGTYQVYGYDTLQSGNLYALCTERCLNLRSQRGWLSFIVQLPLISSSRMADARQLLKDRSGCLVVAPFDDRPGKLFQGLQHCRSTIFLSRGSQDLPKKDLFVTRYQRWPTTTRKELFAKLEYVNVSKSCPAHSPIPKCANALHDSIMSKLSILGRHEVGLLSSLQPTPHFIFYQEAMQYWAKAIVGLPYYEKNGMVGAPAHGRYLYFHEPAIAYAACALLNSSLFYLYFITYGDCFHLNHAMVTTFPTPGNVLNDSRLARAGQTLDNDLRSNAETTSICTRGGDVIAYAQFYGSRSKKALDEIDALLAKPYRLTDEELDFVINYDIKYRMGEELLEEEGEER